MQFTYNQKREKWASAQRSVTVGARGMVSSSQPLATSTGIKILQNGGNAIDAAVAMVCTLSVVEPQSVGIGGDAFALIHFAGEQTPIGINGSGRSPYNARIDWFAGQGMKEVPGVRHIDGMDIYLEDGITDETRSALRAKGHNVMEGAQTVNQAGGGQAIYFDVAQDLLLGASDRRKDGCSAGY